jgi:outer membrane protein OmpA-like peptidoglycan-associated protein
MEIAALVLLIAATLNDYFFASQDTIVILPGTDGHVGSVVVQRDDQRLLLDQAYAAAETTRAAAPLRPSSMPPEQVHEDFREALASRPKPPVSVLLHFEADSQRLTAASKPQLQRIIDEIASRAAAEVTVIGHTDRVGSLAYNDALALARAWSVRELLVAEGIDAEILEIAGRGEREPLIATADGVAEPRNRRTEISIR